MCAIYIVLSGQLLVSIFYIKYRWRRLRCYDNTCSEDIRVSGDYLLNVATKNSQKLCYDERDINIGIVLCWSTETYVCHLHCASGQLLISIFYIKYRWRRLRCYDNTALYSEDIRVSVCQCTYGSELLIVQLHVCVCIHIHYSLRIFNWLNIWVLL